MGKSRRCYGRGRVLPGRLDTADAPVIGSRKLTRDTSQVTGIDLDIEQFKKDVTSKKVKDRVAQDVAQANSLGVTGTPGFFINGRFLSGAQPFSSFKRVIDAELKG